MMGTLSRTDAPASASVYRCTTSADVSALCVTVGGTLSAAAAPVSSAPRRGVAANTCSLHCSRTATCYGVVHCRRVVRVPQQGV